MLLQSYLVQIRVWNEGSPALVPGPGEVITLGWDQESAFFVNFMLVTRTPRCKNQWSRDLKFGRFGIQILALPLPNLFSRH